MTPLECLKFLLEEDLLKNPDIFIVGHSTEYQPVADIVAWVISEAEEEDEK